MTRTVLIVEDDEYIRTDLGELMELEGYRAATCCNGLEAVRYLSEAAPRPDVILLDLMMPVMDGYAFLQWMDTQPLDARVPVLVMSATGQADLHLGERQRRDFLRKPIDLDVLLSAVAKRVAA
jgi:CheY-like chemotaxis protein